MRFARFFALTIIVILVLALLISLILPSKVHIERTTTIDARPEIVFDQINNLHNASRWIPWGQADSNLNLQYSTPAAGAGAYYSWTGTDKQVPPGKFTIISSQTNKTILFKIDVNRVPSSSGGFILYRTLDEEHTYVKWYLDTKVGWWPWWKFYGTMMDRLVGPGMEQGLARLKEICEKSDTYGIKIDEEKIYDRYVVTVSDTLLKQQIAEQLPKIYYGIKKFIQQNNETPNGLPMVQYIKLAGDTIAVNAGIPIGKKISGNKKMHVFHMPTGNVLVAHYFGEENKIKTAYDALQNYAADHHKQSPAGPWQVLVTDTTQVKDSSKWQTDVYFPVY